MKTDIDIINCEQCEQREQPNGNVDLQGSHDKTASANVANDSHINDHDELMTKILRPSFICHVNPFVRDGNEMREGLYWHNVVSTNDGRVEVDEWICTPLRVVAISSSPKSDFFGRLLEFQDSNGKWHTWAMPMHLLKSTGDELRAELLDKGLIFDQKKRNLLTQYILSANSERKIIAASTVGWHKNSFVLPGHVIGNDDVIFQSEEAENDEFVTTGTLDGWQTEIGLHSENNIPLMVSISAVLAGPLFRRANRQQGGGIHWIGDSSSGKSTCVEVAASVWGSPELIRSWSATANGLEGIASVRNDLCLLLDEIDEALTDEVGKIVYLLANGRGKQRAGRTGLARKTSKWCTMTISTGERDLSSIIGESGKRANAGQMVRLLNIPSRFEHGVFSDLHGFSGGRALADHLKVKRLEHHGHVGPAFIRKLIDERGDLSEKLEMLTKQLITCAMSHLEERAAGLFALIALAGELGIEYGLLPWKEGGAINAVTEAFLRWQEFHGVGHTEDQQILKSISSYIEKYADSRFSSYKENSDNQDSRPVNVRSGWFKEDDKNGRVYMFTGEALDEAAGRYPRQRIIDALNKYGWIAERSDKRWTKKVRVQGMTNGKELYHIREVELDHGD